MIDNVPVRVPVAVGEKVTLMVQLLPTASLAGQSFVSAKSPVMVMLVTFSGVAPGLLTVTTCAALVVPTFRAAKVRLSGVNPISGSFSSTVAEPVSPPVVPLPMARSKPPSPLKSAATIPYGNGADVSVIPGPNVPLPSPGKMVTNPKALPLEQVLGGSVRADADVGVVATRSEHKLEVLLWNYHDDDVAAEPAKVKLSIRGFPMGSKFGVGEWLMDAKHSNAYGVWQEMGSPDTPTEEQFRRLQVAGGLLGAPLFTSAVPDKDHLDVSITLERQAVTLIEVTW